MQFYAYDGALSDALMEYISAGIRAGDTCVVIGTRRHMQRLDNALLEAGVNIFSARTSGQYITADAEGAVASFMIDGLPDRNRFSEVIEGVLAVAARRGKPIRAFGEMVAVLWNEGNTEGMLQLEELWNGLAKKYSFALYCAYPEMQFDRSIHAATIDKIIGCHSLVTQSC